MIFSQNLDIDLWHQWCHTDGAMENPFKIKGIARFENFYNRKKEMAQLKRQAIGGQHTLLVAPRRYGKTSLLDQVTLTLNQEQDFYTITLDLFKCASLSEWLSTLGKEIIRVQRGPWQKIRALIQKGLPKLAPKFAVSASGEPEFFFDIEEKKYGIETLDALLTWFDRNTPGRHLIIFDEFQEILNYPDSVKIEKSLRAVIQQLQKTTVFYSGSLPSILKDMFFQKSRAFYQSVLMMELTLTPLQESEKYLAEKFALSNQPVPQHLPKQLSQLSQGHPYYIQLMGFYAWEQFIESENWETVEAEKILTSVFAQERLAFENAIAPLTHLQRQVFRAITQSPDEPPTSQHFISEHKLSAHSSVRKALHKLEALGFILKSEHGFNPADPLMALWWKNV